MHHYQNSPKPTLTKATAPDLDGMLVLVRQMTEIAKAIRAERLKKATATGAANRPNTPALIPRTTGAAPARGANADGTAACKPVPVASRGAQGATALFEANGQHVAATVGNSAATAAAISNEWTPVSGVPGFSAQRGDADHLSRHGVEVAVVGGQAVIRARQKIKAADLIGALRG